ncbi:FHA domain-containing protein [Leptolyngbya sp. FACHB-17]|nr:FHA domain-containing protein [Leptolyngbya sp. FACHB-17]
MEDFDSTNGTYVNGHRILKNQRLKSGDRITLSQTQPEFLFQLETQESSEQVSQTIQQVENNLWGLVHDLSLQTLTGHSSPVRGVAFSSDGKLLVSGGTDKSILLWNLVTGQQVRTFEGHKLAVNAVSYSADGNG